MLRIKEIRLLRKLKQKELSAILKVPVTTLCGWESGFSNPSLKKIIEIADYFDVSVDYLIGRDDKGDK